MKSGLITFERGMVIYPQPVALSCGRICRAHREPEYLDAILKCAEVLTRYLAAVLLSSFCSRQDASVPAPKGLTDFTGNLSFGHFLAMTQLIAKEAAEHPLKVYLTVGFVKKGSKGGEADASLVELLNLRNELGHNLRTISEPKAAAILGHDPSPAEQLAGVLTSLESVLTLPLFVLEEQKLRKKQVFARRLLLMGESLDPVPEEIALVDGLEHDQRVYLGLSDGALCLYPSLRWDLVRSKANFGIRFIHALKDKKVKYVTLENDSEEKNGSLLAEIQDQLTGKIIPKEAASLAGGKGFLQDWLDKRKGIEKAWKETSGQIPWQDLDESTLNWFAQRLGVSGSAEEIRSAVQVRLLDNRDRLRTEEVGQVLLLFGNERPVREHLGRQVIDCRAKKNPDKRWDDRVESSANLLECLKLAIQFFGKHLGIAGVTIDGLDATSGTADYIAMREGLVNMFIHQDYSDQRTVSQIEITKDRAVFFNAGKSLVGNDSLVDGGKSQSRNPLISRALRLIGFAELAGSGLGEIHRAWRKARRRPPVCESNPSSNTFTLTLDWREVPDITDKFWKERLGVELTPHEAAVLTLATDSAGVSVHETASCLGILVSDAKAVCDGLKHKAVVDERQGRSYIKPHLAQLALEAIATAKARPGPGRRKKK
jgi:hypothetical protein